MSELKFFERYLLGQVEPAEIDRYIKEWRQSIVDVSLDDAPTVHEYLGMKKKDYADWRAGKVNLPSLKQRELNKGISVKEVIEQTKMSAPVTPMPPVNVDVEQLDRTVSAIQTKIENQRAVLKEHEDRIEKLVKVSCEAINNLSMRTDMQSEHVNNLEARLDVLISGNSSPQQENQSKYMQIHDAPTIGEVTLTVVSVTEVLESQDTGTVYKVHRYYYQDGVLLFDR